MLPRLASSLVALAIGVSAASIDLNKRQDYTSICAEITAALAPESKVYLPGSSRYDVDMVHWNPSSSQPSACAVEPATAEDIGKVLRIVSKSQTPFTVKSGGHAVNPSFSSTPGVLIVTSQFNGTVYDADAQTATIGTGQTWAEVYPVLQPYNVSVLGGRMSPIGVGGYVMGGGYAWQSSEYGLAVDTVVNFELVQPSGDVINVNEATQPELFWALKGTGNNFGIVTRVTMKTLPQPLVWGGVIAIGPEYIDRMIKAVANYDANVRDVKAALNTVFVHAVGTPGATSNLQVFYNGPEPPAGIFEEVLAIPALSSDIKTRTIGDLVATIQLPTPHRSAFEHIPLNSFPQDIAQAFADEAEGIAAELSETSVTTVAVLVEGFQRTMFSHGSPVPGFSTPSAWPPTRDFAIFPNGFWALYEDSADDDIVASVVYAASNRIREKAAALGFTDMALNSTAVGKYPNYSVWKNTANDIYGSALPELLKLQGKYDPTGVMKLAGGFKL